MQEICFTAKTTLFRRDFQTLNAQASNFHPLCKPKSSCFMRETDFVFPGNFDVAWGLCIEMDNFTHKNIETAYRIAMILFLA